MKIAVLAPVLKPILNQQRYGGIERIIKSLVLASCGAGHDVTLYAAFGTDIRHPRLTTVLATNSSVHGGIRADEVRLFERIISDQDQYDLIHSHIEPIIAFDGGANLMARLRRPVVVTFHNQTYIDENIKYYQEADELKKFTYVFISRNQAKPLSFFPRKEVIYNGIDLSDYTLNTNPGSKQLSFLGRIAPEKGIKEAIMIAKKSGFNLKIGAAIDKSQQNYYETEIKPLVDGKQIQFLGEVGLGEKNKLLGESLAYLFPIKWQEPFGLTMVESLACGTPVIASAIGSVPEIVENNKNGYISKSGDLINNCARFISEKSLSISREYCCKSAERFSESIMTEKYLALYQDEY